MDSQPKREVHPCFSDDSREAEKVWNVKVLDLEFWMRCGSHFPSNHFYILYEAQFFCQHTREADSHGTYFRERIHNIIITSKLPMPVNTRACQGLRPKFWQQFREIIVYFSETLFKEVIKINYFFFKTNQVLH